MLKFKVNEKSLKNVEDNVREAFDRVIKNDQMLNQIGDLVIKDIKYTTRKGLNYTLSQQWRKERKRLAELGQETHPAFSPNRTNLTISGQLVDSLKKFILGKGVVEIRPDGIHEPYIRQAVKKWTSFSKYGKLFDVYRRKPIEQVQVGSKTPNEEIAKGLEDRGIKFIVFNPRLTPRIKQLVINYIRRSTRVLKLFNNK
jgi:hypothetical protein